MKTINNYISNEKISSLDNYITEKLKIGKNNKSNVVSPEYFNENLLVLKFDNFQDWLNNIAKEVLSTLHDPDGFLKQIKRYFDINPLQINIYKRTILSWNSVEDDIQTPVALKNILSEHYFKECTFLKPKDVHIAHNVVYNIKYIAYRFNSIDILTITINEDKKNQITIAVAFEKQNNS